MDIVRFPPVTVKFEAAVPSIDMPVPSIVTAPVEFTSNAAVAISTSPSATRFNTPSPADCIYMASSLNSIFLSVTS